MTASYVQALQMVLPAGGGHADRAPDGQGRCGLRPHRPGRRVRPFGHPRVVTQAVPRLLPAPDLALTVVASFGSLDAATTAVLRLRRERHRRACSSCSTGRASWRSSSSPTTGCRSTRRRSCPVRTGESDRPGHAREDVYRYADVLTEAGGVDIAVADTTTESDLLLAGRRALNHAYDRKGTRLAEDICVPVAALGRPGRRRRSGHLGPDRGRDHPGRTRRRREPPPSFFYDPASEASLRAALRAFDDLVRAAWDLGGTVTGEHGVGTVKARHLATELGLGRSPGNAPSSRSSTRSAS